MIDEQFKDVNFAGEGGNGKGGLLGPRALRVDVATGSGIVCGPS